MFSKILQVACYTKYAVEVFAGIKYGLWGSIPGKDPKKIDDKELQEYGNTIAQTMGLKKSIEIFKASYGHLGGTCFGNGLVRGKAGVVLDPSLLDNIDENGNKITTDEIKFVISHEISHIKANDYIIWQLVPPIIGIATSLLLDPTSPFLSIIIGYAADFYANMKIRIWREKKADENALKYSPQPVREGAVILLQKYEQLEQMSNLPPKIRGQMRAMQLMYPKASDRIAFAQRSIQV